MSKTDELMTNTFKARAHKPKTILKKGRAQQRLIEKEKRMFENLKEKIRTITIVQGVVLSREQITDLLYNTPYKQAQAYLDRMITGKK